MIERIEKVKFMRIYQARTQDFQKGGSTFSLYIEVVGDPRCGGLGAQPPAADEGVIIDIL